MSGSAFVAWWYSMVYHLPRYLVDGVSLVVVDGL